jgi:hypothetical protein
MALLLILHRVADYDAWWQVYDSVADMRESAHVTSGSVRRMADDPNNVLVLHNFDSVEAARAFTTLPKLKEAMQRAGVQGEPRFEFYE